MGGRGVHAVGEGLHARPLLEAAVRVRLGRQLADPVTPHPAVDPHDRVPEQLGEPSVDVAPGHVHLVKPVRTHRVALCDHEVVERAGPHVRHAAGVAGDRHRRIDRDAGLGSLDCGDPGSSRPSDAAGVDHEEENKEPNQGSEGKSDSANQQTGHRPSRIGSRSRNPPDSRLTKRR